VTKLMPDESTETFQRAKQRGPGGGTVGSKDSVNVVEAIRVRHSHAVISHQQGREHDGVGRLAGAVVGLEIGRVVLGDDLAAFLGGAYSSTVTTVVLAKRAKRENRPHLFSGVTLVASGMMYLRLAGLVTIFNRKLITILGVPFLILAGGSIVCGWLWSRIPDAKTGDVEREFQPKNPLELRAALGFAVLFATMLVATHLVVTYLGKAGVYSLAGLMGVTDVDPFIMGMTQAAGSSAPPGVAAAGILIAASSNNLAKGIYAYSLSDRKTGVLSLILLATLAAAGFTPLLWLAR